MRIARRRIRRDDPLVSLSAIRLILERLRDSLPRLIPNNEKQIVKLLRAVSHIERYSATDIKRGRHLRWERTDLFQVPAQLRQILERETQGRVSLASFIGHYHKSARLPFGHRCPTRTIKGRRSGRTPAPKTAKAGSETEKSNTTIK